MRTAITLLFTMLLGVALHAQGTVRGKVVDIKGETLIGATVVLKSDRGTGTVADLDGAFSLKIASATGETLVFSYIGFESKEIPVYPKNGEVVVVNVILGESGVALKEFEVEGRARRGADTYLDRMKMNSATSLDFISRDAMLKTGDSDAGAAIKRVSGVSTVGAFVTVRGLADRYLVTTVNGARIPTLDPLTNNIRLDIFPTGLLDNIIITKTLTPDLPGDWAGAYLSLNASDFPDRLQVSFSTGMGYNTNASFKDIISSTHSSTDWLGHDDGLRGIPDGVPTNADDFPRFIEPDLYQQLGVLGLSGYLTSLGITHDTPGFQTTTMTTDNVFQHLALTELGLLGSAQLFDPNAVQNAVSSYNNTYDLSYFSPILNAQLADYNSRFDNSHWRVTRRQGSPNFNQTLSIGNQIELFKKRRQPWTLGYIIGGRYDAETQYDPASAIQRTGEPYDDPDPGTDFGVQGIQQVSVETNRWSAVGNLGLKIGRNNSFSLMVMPSQVGQNNARYMEFLQPGLLGDTLVSEDQFYEQRKLWVYQYGSKHLIPALNLTVEADASYSDGKRDLLDMRIVQFVKPPPGRPASEVEGQLIPPGRLYRFMNETILDTRLSFEFPLAEPTPEISRKLKFGGAYRSNQRENSQVYFLVRGAPGPEQWELPGIFAMRPDGRFTSLYTPFGTFKDNDIGILNVLSGFVMTDYGITPRLRVVTGVRAEHTDLLSDIFKYHEDGLAAEDPLRGFVGEEPFAGASSAEPQPARPGMIDRWDLLPSANFIYKLVDDQERPMNLRVAYFRSLARPSFREYSPVQLFDYQLRSFTFGNPNLKMTQVDNLDLRVERFFTGGSTLSLTGFYKEFKNHIELLRTAVGGFTWRNADRSVVYGAELEGRTRLTPRFEVRGNLTWMYSRSELKTFGGTGATLTSPMYGQAPWLANVTVSYAPDSSRFSASVSYNVQGPRLAITNSELAPDAPRAYEMPRHLVDITINQKLGAHWNLTVKGRNILNSPVRRSYKFASGYDYDFDRYTWGSDFSLTIGYTIK